MLIVTQPSTCVIVNLGECTKCNPNLQSTTDLDEAFEYIKRSFDAIHQIEQAILYGDPVVIDGRTYEEKRDDALETELHNLQNWVKSGEIPDTATTQARISEIKGLLGWEID